MNLQKRYPEKWSFPPPVSIEQISKYNLNEDVVKFMTTVSSYDWLIQLEENKTELFLETCDYLYDEWNYVKYNIQTDEVCEMRHDYPYEYSSFAEYIKELERTTS